MHVLLNLCYFVGSVVLLVIGLGDLILLSHSPTDTAVSGLTIGGGAAGLWWTTKRLFSRPVGATPEHHVITHEAVREPQRLPQGAIESA